MDLESFQQSRWLSVYGPYLAGLVQMRILHGRALPSPEDMKNLVAEAAAIADMDAVANGAPTRSNRRNG